MVQCNVHGIHHSAWSLIIMGHKLIGKMVPDKPNNDADILVQDY